VALLLIAAEVIMPGYFLLWVGLAAGALGVVMWGVPTLGILTQAVLFVALSFISCFLYLKVVRPNELRRGEGKGDRHLNRRGEQLIGHRYVLDSAIVNGRGKARVGDSLWLVEGPDLPAGTAIEVVGVEGSLLRVREAA
jgi:membrane protein implicated in regulation of membrane protease activity